MTDDLLSLRVLVATNTEGVANLFRQAAAAASVPIEIVAAADAATVTQSLEGSDIAYIDGALPPQEIAQVFSVLRSAAKPPFSILLATAATAGKAFVTDGIAGKPSRIEESQWLLDRSMRVRLPSRVLVVDDSATMRSIVRKSLAATRFQFHVTEAAEGLAALQLVRDSEFDIVFLDYNMPGFSGLETLSEFKREKRRVSVVMITSAEDDAVAGRARALGAAFLKKPFFPADIETVLCGYYGLRALNPRHA
jgi:CheY-like chemotaxis protein